MNGGAVRESLAIRTGVALLAHPMIAPHSHPGGASNLPVLLTVPKKNQDVAVTRDQLSHFGVLSRPIPRSGLCRHWNLPSRFGPRQERAKFRQRFCSDKVSLVFSLLHRQRHDKVDPGCQGHFRGQAIGSLRQRSQELKWSVGIGRAKR